ncbi:TetR/AcrR family transcriptional regulator [bacterium]|nr:TetR/AcrR family transcriptional regulator [bacterium]
MANLNEKVDELKKNLILETASEYFKTLGYGKTQIDKISKDLNIGVGTIYGYFKSKEGLFIAWLQNIINNVYVQMKEGCENVSDPIEKLAVVIDYKVSYFEKNRVTVKSYMENNQLFLRGISRRKEHPMAVILEFCADIIKEIKPMSDDEAYLLANIFDGIINTYIECSFEDEQLFGKKDEILERFLRVVGV